MNELKQKINELLSAKDPKGAIREIKKRHASEVAEILREMQPRDRNLLFALLPAKLAAKAFAYLHLKEQKYFLNTLKNAQVRILLSNLSPDDRTHLFESLPAKRRKNCLICFLSLIYEKPNSF